MFIDGDFFSWYKLQIKSALINFEGGIMSEKYSVSPEGEKFPLPKQEDFALEFESLKKRAEEERAKGREIVVVMGVGFVGAVMAAIVADTTDKDGNPTKFVIGMQRPSERSFWKIPLLNRGVSPVKAEDPEVEPMIIELNKHSKIPGGNVGIFFAS